MSRKSIPAVILGGSGYVAAELIGLIFDHPSFFVETVVSSSFVGNRIDEVFPHLTGLVQDYSFGEIESARSRIQGRRQVAVFSALPHGDAAPILNDLLPEVTAAKVVDVSADFRHRDPNVYEKVYGKTHFAPDLLAKFCCGLPDLNPLESADYVSHPGCFTTGVVLGAAGLFATGLIENQIHVSSVTGSTGAGKQHGAGTHHPHRQSSMWAYQPLTHRHKPEMEELLSEYCPDVKVNFVPHSGSFSRGIHSTIFGQLKHPVKTLDVVDRLREFYRATPFIKISDKLPTLKEIVGTNRCHIGAFVDGSQIVVTSVIDNLVKGAAGGAVQWMNRLFGLEETEGLIHAVPGWI